MIKKVFSRIRSNFFKYQLFESGKKITIGKRNRFIGLQNISIGNKFAALDGLWLEARKMHDNSEPSIVIGENVHISRNCHIGAINKINIGKNTLIGSNVLIEDHTHGHTFDYSDIRINLKLVSKGPIEIGENCWICDNVIITGGGYYRR